MAQPTPYDRIASFSNIQAQAPSDPLPGNTLDAEFNAAKETLDEVLANLALIQRDDGALANNSVGLDQLSEDIEVGWQAPRVWVTATAFVSGDTVFHGSAFYRLLVAHTSGTFATDLAAGKWELIVDLGGLTIVAADQIAVTPAGGIAATDVQAALEELDAEKAASSHGHPASAITDSTGPGRTLLTAATTAAQRTALGLGDLALEDTVPVTEIDAQIALTGIIEPAALSANVNDWTPVGIGTCSTIRVSASAAVNITGLLAPADDGDIKILENVGSTFAVTLLPSSTSSAAANRFLFQRPIILGPNASVALRYDADATTPRWRLFDSPSRLPRGHIDGLIISNNASDATNDIDISVGEARGTRGLLDLVLTSAMTKRLDADWAAGTNQGGRYASAAIANSTYHVYLIGKADGTTDIFLIDYTSADPTTSLPSGYIDYYRIGSILRESAVIVPFVQNGNYFLRKTEQQVSATNPGTGNVNHTLFVPLGIRVEADLTFGITANGVSGAIYGLVMPIDSASETPSTGLSHVQSTDAAAPYVARSAVSRRVLTSTSGQVRTIISGSNSNIIVTLHLRGWVDKRGRDL